MARLINRVIGKYFLLSSVLKRQKEARNGPFKKSRNSVVGGATIYPEQIH